MRKILSIIVLALCSYVSVIAITLVSTIIFFLIEMLYENSRALFWVVLLGGGSFGLWLFWMIIPIATTLTISASQKIALSKKGLRYTIMGILVIGIWGLNTLGLIINKNATNLPASILAYVLIVFFAITLIIQGKEIAQEEYVSPPIDVINDTTTFNKTSDKDIPTESLKALKDLHDGGVITEEEFAEKKKQLLNLKKSNEEKE